MCDYMQNVICISTIEQFSLEVRVQNNNVLSTRKI